MNTEILLDHEPVADGGYVVRALLKVTGQAPEADDRPPLNLAVVLDRSGSMAGPPLERAKEAAALLIKRLAGDDVISLVAYDEHVQTVAGRVPGSMRHELRDRLAGLLAGSTTNLSGGWLRGRDLVAQGLTDGAVNRVLLLTDGLANVGITNPGALRDMVATAAAQGVSSTTIGFGPGYDEVLLRQLAEAGGGSTYYIESPDQAPAVFEAEIDGLMALAAQNLAVTVKPGMAVDHATVLHGYPSSDDDGSLRLELGDLYALEPKSLLVEFLTRDDGAAETDVATLTLEGHVLLPDGGIEKQTLTVPITVNREDGAVAHPEVRREMILLQAARAREEAVRDQRRGRFEDGARKLRDIAEKLAPLVDAAATGDDPDLAADLTDEVEDLRDMAERFERERVSEADAKYMRMRSYSRASSKEAAVEMLKEERARGREERS